MKKKEIKISREKFTHLLLSGVLFQGASFVGIDSLTVEPLEGGKKNPMLGKVLKQREGALCLLFTNANASSYATMVNKRLAEEGKEPNFVPGKRAWGERMENMPIIQHEKDGVTNYYLEVIEAQSPISLAKKAEEDYGIVLSDVDKEAMSNYVVGRQSIKRSSITYWLEEQEIAKQDIQGLKVKKEGEQGGLGEDNKVIIRSYKVESLLRVTIKGETYLIHD